MVLKAGVIDMETIFLGGIHGSGKSHLGDWLGQALGIVHYSAGELLSASTKRRMQAPRSTDENQLLILQQLTELTHPHERIVLDGHFALVSVDEEVTPVPTHHWIPLSPIALLLVDTPVEVCLRRLEVCEGSKWKIRHLEELRLAELSTAEDVSEALGIPLAIIRPPSEYHQALAHLRATLR